MAIKDADNVPGIGSGPTYSANRHRLLLRKAMPTVDEDVLLLRGLAQCDCFLRLGGEEACCRCASARVLGLDAVRSLGFADGPLGGSSVRLFVAGAALGWGSAS
ncbi:hypothetical protein NDU88_001877 [Pleurodeles waltl]|uniref:Uncharacterized protein n=1 Tax=Pleurodeles waltl TaxID=8319 RepID=A0AAV7U842_PLEWA|nr:hypothetical protein NDU88_001877 [Pleurodeles waltl]